MLSKVTRQFAAVWYIPRPDGGGGGWGKGPPGVFSSITQIRLRIALWNFQYLSEHQFYASSKKILPEVTQGQKL